MPEARESLWGLWAVLRNEPRIKERRTLKGIWAFRLRESPMNLTSTVRQQNRTPASGQFEEAQ